MLRKLFNIVAIIALMAGFLYSGNVMAQDIVDPDPGTDIVNQTGHQKKIDEPNPLDYQRNLARAALMRQGDMAAEASALTLAGTDKVLVILVEFAGLDTFTWTRGTSTWDPLNRGLASEGAGITAATSPADRCNNIAATTGNYSYSGPMHNQIPTPQSEADASGVNIWTQDFNPQWFADFMFGNGVKINYQRVDGSVVNESFIGRSVKNYYKDMSNGLYDIEGNVVGWLSLPHSAMWYANNQCPGARSGAPSNVTVGKNGNNIPGAGSTRTMVKDALDAVNAKIAAGDLPGFNWKDYDLNGDGVVDRLWIVHAGYGEEDNPTLLNRTNYGEGIPWSHSTGGSPVLVDPVNNISTGPYIIMPENGGIGVFAHESGHNLGADDLYSYSGGETSVGFWSLMSDDWTGYPIGFQPPSVDPMHLDWWGWLNPTVITDPTKVYTVTLQQASTGPSAVPAGAVKGARIDLPQGKIAQPVSVWQGSYYWFGGKQNSMNSMMTSKTPIALPAGGATNPSLSFDLAYNIEDEWDFLWVQVSDDAGTSWKTLTNNHTICTHDPDWVGESNGFPTDMCAAGIGGFTKHNAEFPFYETQYFDLAAFAGKNILLRFWYMTDSGTVYEGPFLDNIQIVMAAGLADGAAVPPIFADDAETVNNNWIYTTTIGGESFTPPLWVRNDGFVGYDQSFYIQWRNTNANGGYDAALGDVRWRYGKANTGMLVWYNNTLYSDNEIPYYLTDYPSFGPKGMMMVVDSQPIPYRYPSKVAQYPNEGANLPSRGMMRDAPFTLTDTVNFNYPDAGVSKLFAGQPAVKTFHDALGYYPGSELVVGGGAAQTTPRWITKQWDASVVIPSKSAYAPNAPGYTKSQIWRYNCTITAAGSTSCSAPGDFATFGLATDGGNGNPADVAGQYGWHIELVQEGLEHNWATVRIWNSQYAMDSMVVPNQPRANLNDTITYTASFKNTGSTATFLACAAIDTSKVTYVAGSATGSPLELPACPVAGADMVADSSVPVGALVWQLKDVIPGATPGAVQGTPGFTYQVKAVKAGVATTSASIISFPPNQTIYSSQTTKPLVIGTLLFIPTQYNTLVTR
jgi:immune inhibitor A